jgi:AraC-like DNA-binding protein
MDHRLAQIIKRLSDNPNRRFRLSALAKEVRLTERRVEQLFKAEMGTTFVAYYRALRMRLARRLLRDTSQPVKAIAADLGYGAVEVFCREFKRAHGCTAGEFRRRSRNSRYQR